MKHADLYVSPFGNDTWSGRLPEPNATQTDGPLRTLPAAQAAIRQHKANLASPAELRVCLRGGQYELMEPWRFTAEDSGFGRDDTVWPRRARTWPITWAAWEGETPVISGGRRLTGQWQEQTINGCTAWTMPVAVDHPFSQLWVNGERRWRPRLPKKGVRKVAEAINPNFKIHGHNDSATGFGFHKGELSAAWHNLQDVELRFFGWWLDRTVKLKGVDEAACIASFDRDVRLRLEWGPGDGIDYVVENLFEALTEPGEWYYDRPAGLLWYLPMPGEEMESVDVTIPRLDSLFELDGATNLRFEGLDFAYSEWTLPEELSGSMQAAVHVPAAVQLRRANDVVFTDCTIEHVGTYGAELLDGCIETIFAHCTLRDLGGGGVRIWHGCRRNALRDCEIGDGGHRFACAVGVLIGKATGNSVVHCHLHDFYYTGISVGWNWGYAESDGYGNIIEWNHIHDIGKGLLSDMGGIYLLGHASGTRLRYNHIHDIDCRRYGGWCIYTDEGSTDVLIESNLCYRANRTIYNQHYGRNNQIRHNIFAYGGDAVLSYGAPEPHLGLIFEHNILLSQQTPILRDASPDRWTPRQTAFHGNLYWCEDGPVCFERGGVAMYGSQPFPHGYLMEAPRFAPLTATSDQPQHVTTFHTRSGIGAAPADAAEISFELEGDQLLVTGRFQRPGGVEVASGPVWNREHVELFLRPFDDAEAVVQLGLASDGERAIHWHGCEAPEAFAWEAIATDQGDHWACTLRIPLTPIAAAAGGHSPAWRFLAGFAVPASTGDFASWQAQGHDPAGRVADPRFADPHHGDFCLADDSPAFDLGFVPFDLSRVGPRPPLTMPGA